MPINGYICGYIVSPMCMCPQRPQKASYCPRVNVRGYWDPANSMYVLGTNSGHLEVLLVPKPTLQLDQMWFCMNFGIFL